MDLHGILGDTLWQMPPVTRQVPYEVVDAYLAACDSVSNDRRRVQRAVDHLGVLAAPSFLQHLEEKHTGFFEAVWSEFAWCGLANAVAGTTSPEIKTKAAQLLIDHVTSE